jgi:hypothetical protein
VGVALRRLEEDLDGVDRGDIVDSLEHEIHKPPTGHEPT